MRASVLLTLLVFSSPLYEHSIPLDCLPTYLPIYLGTNECTALDFLHIGNAWRYMEQDGGKGIWGMEDGK